MSSEGIDQAIERIAADAGFATSVLSDRTALESFDLTETERTSVVDALAADLEAAGYEVLPFALDAMSINWGDVQLNNTAELGQFHGAFGRQQNPLLGYEMNDAP